MNTDEPGNDVERAIAGAMRGPQGYPALFRQLLAADLTVLMPYHPEMDGTMEVGEGDQITVTFWKNGDEQVIPVFTSGERAQQALRAIGQKGQPWCLAEIGGDALFKILQSYHMKVVINPACPSGEMHLDANAVQKLADGSILQPTAGTLECQGVARPVDPADYPTDLLQALFEFLRSREDVQAAWILETQPEPGDPDRQYVFALLAVDAGEELEQDFIVVAQNVRSREASYGVMLLDPRLATHAKIIARISPFYAAPGFRSAGGPPLDE
jgi:hypothetical protein